MTIARDVEPVTTEDLEELAAMLATSEPEPVTMDLRLSAILGRLGDLLWITGHVPRMSRARWLQVYWRTVDKAREQVDGGLTDVTGRYTGGPR